MAARKLNIPSQTDLQNMPGAKEAPAMKKALREIEVLAQRQISMEDELRGIMVTADDLNKRLFRLKTIDLPTAMKTAGTKGLVLTDGTKVDVKDMVVGNIKAENEVKAFAWFRKNGFGSLIKNMIKAAFGMGDDKKAAMLKKFLLTKKIPFEENEGVNRNTLCAFVRERLQAGKELPPEIDVTSVPTAVITRVKS